ncbi:hypothetical protein R6Q59_008733 [Mikania micrantha]
MAGTVQTLTNLINPVAGTVNLRSTNSKSNKRSFDVINNSLIYTKARSIKRTLVVRNNTNSDQIQENGSPDQPARKSGIVSFSAMVETLLSFASNNFLPLALIGGVTLGLANPYPGCLAHRYQLSKASTIGIFIMSGLTLRSEDVSAAAEAWPVGLFGLVRENQELVRMGLALFCCMPTTLSSGVALTRVVNSSIAVFNIKADSLWTGGVSPNWKIIQKAHCHTFDTFNFGKGLADFADQNRKLLSVLSVLLLSLVPWIQVSRSRSLLLAVKPAAFLVVVMMGVLLHLILLGFNAVSIRCLCALSGDNKSIFAKKENSTALLLVASQKALPVLVAVVDQLGSKFGEPGLLIIPCVAAHLNQIIMDSILVSYLNKNEESIDNITLPQLYKTSVAKDN